MAISEIIETTGARCPTGRPPGSVRVHSLLVSAPHTIFRLGATFKRHVNLITGTERRLDRSS